MLELSKCLRRRLVWLEDLPGNNRHRFAASQTHTFDILRLAPSNATAQREFHDTRLRARWETGLTLGSTETSKRREGNSEDN